MTAVAEAALLAVAAAAVALSVAGLLLARGALARVHYLAPAALVAPPCVAAAIGLEEGLSAATAQATVVALFLVASSPAVAQLLGRTLHGRGTGTGSGRRERRGSGR